MAVLVRLASATPYTRMSLNEIGVAVKGGIVTLAGWVDSFTKRWGAEEAAYRVLGLKAVRNDIEIRIPGSSERTDSGIASAAGLRSSRIRVRDG